MRIFARMMVLAGVVTMVAAAQAQVKVWEWPGGGGNNAAGEIRKITATFNTITNQMTWHANFGPVPGSSSLKTDGFHLVVSPGANPKGHAGELAILYFDGSSAGSPKLTAYNYNGVNGNNSYLDGSQASGTQAPDKIKSSVASMDWINSMTVRDEADGSRTLGFDIDATAINGHSPMYPGNTPWTGLEFGDKIGVWFHSYAGTVTSYGPDGYLSTLNMKKEGWLDLENQQTSTVPEPTTMAATGLFLAGLIAKKRRRKA